MERIQKVTIAKGSNPENAVKKLVDLLGGIQLKDLQPYHLSSYYAKKCSDGRADGKGGLSARSVVYHHRILSKALDYAVKMGVAVRNVASVVCWFGPLPAAALRADDAVEKTSRAP